MPLQHGVLNEQFPARCDWGVVPLPVVDKNNKYMQVCSNGDSLLINAESVKTKDPEKLLTCLKWFESDECKRTMYKEGLEIPYDWSIVDDIDASNVKKGWAEFAKLTEISHYSSLIPESDMTGYMSLKDRIINDVLSGNVSAEDMLAQYNKDIIEATKKYYELNIDESLDSYIDKSWNIKR